MAAVGRHPRIIGVRAACLEQPLAVVQELAHGSLHDQLHTLRLRPQYGLLMQLAEDVASALEHCHAQRPPVVHRDLSGRNVLLGGDGRARLADFGLAAAKRRTFLSTDKAGALGTAAYMAPEAMTAGQITERCDVFGFGVLLWELLTGRQAWEEYDSPLQVIFAVGVERRRLPIPPGCPPALAKLLKECWRHNAPLRPSFTEVLQRLRQMQRADQFQLVGPLVPAPAASEKAAARATSGSAASSSSKAGSQLGKGRRILPVSAVAAASRAARPPLPASS
ncbi:serine threonine- kinase EDR1 [Chlorella sorokiniana]|uniref:Serine threonine-kinase EDR1 n=1 Tax=Chlorella sorokiniana TaxID=3076 RepID=A0A2P6TBS6_CHLSO|nr:serine threonine- kinase EDR1 [Chlorella sorokiniana]|eukprot:PRW18330.1 serine threonine- kinase EDR1 [Chlorella sorokiniana]